jgi:hypothetical protein
MPDAGSMQAAILDGAKLPFRIASVGRPKATAGQVLVRIQASGVNPLDLKIRAGQAAHARHSLPAILGIDLAGIVEDVGTVANHDDSSTAADRGDRDHVAEDCGVRLADIFDRTTKTLVDPCNGPGAGTSSPSGIIEMSGLAQIAGTFAHTAQVRPPRYLSNSDAVDSATDDEKIDEIGWHYAVAAFPAGLAGPSCTP